MFHVITGGSGSGKSAYAETCILRYHQSRLGCQGPLCYIATMEPYGKETEVKIEKHRRMRAGKGFQTIECYRDLSLTTARLENKKACVLLECMSNLVANEFYDAVNRGAEASSDDKVVEKIWNAVASLQKNSEVLVVVTNEVCSAYEEVSGEMVRYKQILSEINRKMASCADKVTEVVYGIPVELGGKR